MASIRIEFLKVAQNDAPFSNGADNVISEVLLAEDFTISGSAALNANAAPLGTQAARITSIGGVAYVNNKGTATATKSIRLADGKDVIVDMRATKKISAMTGT
jgi:hypothetical protein